MQTVEIVASPSGSRQESQPDSPRLGKQFWRLFVVCLSFDVGFGLYFFLINLYLAQLHMGEKAIGMVAGALTIGNVAATIPTGLLARRVGLRPILLFAFLAAPLLAAARIAAPQPALQLLLAFAQGIAMCSYTVSFAPAIAALTSSRNRTVAFSIMFGTGIGSGVLGGLAGGQGPEWLRHLYPSLGLRGGMAYVLLGGCIIAGVGALPLLRLRFPHTPASDPPPIRGMYTPFLLRFMSMVAVWNLAIGVIAPFASLYLAGPMHIALPRVGAVFSASQLLQVTGILAVPALYRRIGQARGIALLQAAAAACLLLLFGTHRVAWVIGEYLCLAAFQYMCNPAIYGLLMDRMDEQLRASASAVQNLVSCCAVAGASLLGGIVISRFSYAQLFLISSGFSFAASALTWFVTRFEVGASAPARNL